MASEKSQKLGTQYSVHLFPGGVAVTDKVIHIPDGVEVVSFYSSSFGLGMDNCSVRFDDGQPIPFSVPGDNHPIRFELARDTAGRRFREMRLTTPGGFAAQLVVIFGDLEPR